MGAMTTPRERPGVPVAAAYADRMLFLADGRIVGELAAPAPDPVHTRMRKPEG